MFCQCSLISIKWNNSYLNVPYFRNVTHRDTYFNNLIQNVATKTINFDFGNFLFTNIVVNNYKNENYCVIKRDNLTYYYYITNATYISVNQYRLTLECDVMTQYVTGCKDNKSLSRCLIHRAHCDRFRDIGNGKVIFNVNNSSHIIEPETKFEKVTKRRHEIKIKYSSKEYVNKWLQDNIIGWQYMYVAVNHNYKVTGTSSGYAPRAHNEVYNKAYSKRGYNVGGSLFQDEFSLCCVPIYKNNQNCIYIVDELNQIKAKIDSFEFFRKQNEDNSYIYNIKYSIHPPFNFDDIGGLPVNGNLYIYKECKQDASLSGLFTFFDFGTFDVDCFGEGYKDGNVLYRPHNIFSNLNYTTTQCAEVNTESRFEFSKSELKGNRNVTFEPKILVDCKSVTLRDSSNGQYVYPALYIGNNVVQPYYNESMSITNNNYYVRLGNVGIIPNADKNNWNGVVNTVDYSQQIANNSYAEFVANNKNFLLSKGLNMLTNGLQGNVLGVASDLYNVWQGLDNLENKPNSMRNTNDSVELNLLVNNGLKLYVDEDVAREVDINRYYDYLFAYGYRVNEFTYPHLYIDTRVNFNYIQADVEYINVPCPDVVENKIKEIFRQGVRLWNNVENMYNYELENYEKWM